MAKLTIRTLKIFKTCNLYLCFLVLGMCVAIPGPTLLDLQHIVNTDTKYIAFIYTARSTGYLVGSLIGGIVFDMVSRKQALLTVLNLIISITALGIPWSRQIGALTGWMTINGVVLGAIDIGGNVCCLSLWGKDSGPFYQALHFTFGLGGLLAPLIAAPFLERYDLKITDTVNGTMDFTNRTLFQGNATENMQNNSFMFDSTIPTVTYAYTIIGSFSFLVTILFLIVCIISPLEDDERQKEGTQKQPFSFSFMFALVALNNILIFVETGTEIGYAQMLTTHAVKGRLKLSKAVGSYMTSAFWAAFTIARFASVFLAIKFSSFTLIVFDITVTSIGAVILLFAAVTNEWALWLASVLIGMGIASFFPAAIGWLDTYVVVTNKLASVFTVGAAFGEMVVPYTITHFIEEVPEVLAYVVPTSCSFSALIIIIMYLMLRNKPERKAPNEVSCSVINAPSVNS